VAIGAGAIADRDAASRVEPGWQTRAGRDTHGGPDAGDGVHAIDVEHILARERAGVRVVPPLPPRERAGVRVDFR
jgi:hypothetical protein